MSPTTVKVLSLAREIYESSPSHVPGSQSPAPGTYCMVTALTTACDCTGAARFFAAYRALKLSIDGRALADFNAEHTTEEVLAMFDKAITLA